MAAVEDEFVRERLAGARHCRNLSAAEEEIPTDIPDSLTLAFAEDPAKQQQWTAFVRGLEEDVPSLVDTIADLAEFLMPVVAMARQPTG